MDISRLVRDLTRRFRRNDSGAAAVEFALILPFLLLLYMGSIEASSLFTVDRRIEVIAATNADLISRWNPNVSVIPSSTVRDYFRAAEGIITPYTTTGLKQVVSFLNVATDGTATVAWSCGWNGGTRLPNNQTYPLKVEMKKLVTGATAQGNGNLTGGKEGFLIASTIEYSYKPLLGMVFPNALTLKSEALFLPRFGQTLTAPNGGCPT